MRHSRPHNEKLLLVDKQSIALPNDAFSFNLDQTKRPPLDAPDFFWDGDWFNYAGRKRANCQSFHHLDANLARSLREHLLEFANEKNYAGSSILNAVQALRHTIGTHATTKLDRSWMLKSLATPSFVMAKRVLESFFVFWSDRSSAAIEPEALLTLKRTKARNTYSSNVLSDDPIKSWLTDIEYDALLQRVWLSYDSEVMTTQVALMLLLSMQYARRPVQLASLKIGDFRDGAENTPRIRGRHVLFPGAKDKNAEEHFRDSKVEIHPIADHLWNLFEIQKHEVKKLFEATLGRSLEEKDLQELPLFTSKNQIEHGARSISEHYGLNWEDHLSHQLFHVSTHSASRILRRKLAGSLQSDRKSVIKPPLSHRTGEPIYVGATRMRHTRARQLARMGMPKNVLSFWLGHTSEDSLASYYNDPAEEARKIGAAMEGVLAPLALAFTGRLIDSESQATRADDPESKLEFANMGALKNVGSCGKYSFCATTTVPVPCYRCKLFEPLVFAPHQEVLDALLKRQADEKAMIKIGGTRQLLIPIDLSADIRAVQSCIDRCNARKAELNEQHD